MSDDISQMIEDCEARDTKLSEWEQQFIDSISKQLERGRSRQRNSGGDGESEILSGAVVHLCGHQSGREVPAIAGRILLSAAEQQRQADRRIEGDLLHRAYVDVELRDPGGNRIVVPV